MDSFFSLALSAAFFVGLARQIQLGLNQRESAVRPHPIQARREQL